MDANVERGMVGSVGSVGSMTVESGLGLGDGLGLGKTINRRRLMRLVAGAGASAVVGGVLARGASATSGSEIFRTTTALNLRKRPSSSAQVLAVIPANTLVKLRSWQASNGFLNVSYDGKTGWAYADFLESYVGDPDVNWLGDAQTTTAVNFRYEPSTSSGVIVVIAKGKTVKISDWVQNGYRYVDAQGATGWIYDDFLGPVDQETGPLNFKTTTAVNLRANPSTSAKILKVVPAGMVVIDYDLVMSNGYRGVDYSGTVGWIYDAFLQQI
jgi:SH3-like domain-containing protein